MKPFTVNPPMNEVTLKIRVSKMFILRLKVGLFLVKLAARIAGFNIEVQRDSS